MEAKYLNTGEMLCVIFSREVQRGEIFVLNHLIGIAADDTPARRPCNVYLSGAFEVPKDLGESFECGDLIFWDTASRTATTQQGSAFRPLGHAVCPAKPTDSRAWIRLCQSCSL